MRPCSLQLDVYLPGGLVVDWSVSTDSDHARPYLLAPTNYDSQEIDPIAGGASIGTVEVGVIDPHQVAGDQTSGFMTERIGSIRGRRCVLRRYVNATIGWVMIADGPAGAPRLDSSYSAYRWQIRDTREIERKVRAFNDGRSTAIAPRGPIAGFGDLGAGDWLLDPVEDSPLVGTYEVNEGSMFGVRIGFVDIDWTDPTTPIAAAVISEDGEAALQTQGDVDRSVAPAADILWRVAGSGDPWNIARPVWPAPFTAGQLQLADVDDGVLLGADVRAIRRIYLWAKPIGEASDGTEPFGADAIAGVGTDLELIVRHRGPATDELPFYFEGSAADFLRALYRGELSGVDTVETAGGDLYDPAGLNEIATDLAGSVLFDDAAIEQLADLPVLIRETDATDDGRDYAESKIYAPSGWIPALDQDGAVSPVSRARPSSVTGPTINDARTEPSPDWNAGEIVVTSVEVAYHRYFVPTYSNIETEPDGLAIKDVTLRYVDPDAIVVEGKDQPQAYDGSAFSAPGDAAGNAIPGDTEAAALLAEEARYEVLGRYRTGAQAMRVRVRRADDPTLRVGAWRPASISWFPNTTTGLRGLNLDAVQVLSIDNSECAWMNLLIEASEVIAPPGYFTDPELVSDEAAPGYFDEPDLVSDEPSPP
jgi:hypothetical protein